MKPYLKFLTVIAVTLTVVMSVSSHAQDQKSSVEEESFSYQVFGEGLPLPWPFPWAKECAVNWDTLTGRYAMESDLEGDQIDLKISIINRLGDRWARVFRFNKEGRLIAEGASPIKKELRAIRVKMRSVVKDNKVSWISLRLHYADAAYQCYESRLVPILTMETMRGNSLVETQYRLIRL